MNQEYTCEEIEKYYNDLINLEKETKEFFIFICGYHSVCEKKKIFKEGQVKTNELYKKSCEIFPPNFSFMNEKKYIFSDGNIYSLNFIYTEYLRIIRNVRSWLNVIFAFYQFQRDI